MPLFGRERDIRFFRGINKELLRDVISQQISFYKLEMSSTPFNIYGEASREKFYGGPVLVNCLIERGDQKYNETDFGPDLGWDHNFWLLNADLKDINLLPEVGDIIEYEFNFYEVYELVQNQLFMGKDPSKAIKPNPYTSNIDKYGFNVSTICKTHYTPKDKVGINLQERII